MKFKLLNLLLLVIAIGVPVVMYSRLPEMIPMHWNINGEIDDWWPKQTGAWFIPGLIAVIWGLFRILPKFDPKGAEYKKFWREWEAMQLGIIGFLVYTEMIIIGAAINPGLETRTWIFSGMGILFLMIGTVLPKITQNYFVGIKVPWTLADKDNWEMTHRFGGKCFLAAGGLMLLTGVTNIFPPGWIFGIMMGLLILPIGYSYKLYSDKRKQVK